MIGKTSFDIFPEEMRRPIDAADNAALRAGARSDRHEYVVLTPGGAQCLLSSRRIGINGADGTPQFLLSLGEDVTERQRAVERIAFMAHHDPLTRLPNRATFHEHLARMFEEASRSGKGFAVLCVASTASRRSTTSSGMRRRRVPEAGRGASAGAAEGAFLARLGGDEFTLITACGPQPANGRDSGRALARIASGDVESRDTRSVSG